MILALETTEKFGSAAILKDRQVLSEIVLPRNQRSSRTLHPALQTLFETVQIIPPEIDVVAVVAGPGSFTGLRVGVTAAKVFAYTLGTKIIALDTFQTVAAALPMHAGMISVGVDAQRGDVVAALLRQTRPGHAEMVKKPEMMNVNDWWKHAEEHENVLFAGPALERWGTQTPAGLILADEADWFPKAAAAGRLATERITTKQFDDVWALSPIYSRMSAAEERT